MARKSAKRRTVNGIAETPRTQEGHARPGRTSAERAFFAVAPFHVSLPGGEKMRALVISASLCAILGTAYLLATKQPTDQNESEHYPTQEEAVKPNSTQPNEHLENKLRALESRVHALEVEQQRVLDERTPNQGDSHSEHREDSISEHVAAALQDERESAIDRRIAMRQKMDLEAIGDFAEQTTLSASQRERLEEVVMAATARHTVLNDEAFDTRRPIKEIRADVRDTIASAVDQIRSILSPEQVLLFGRIASEHGILLNQSVFPPPMSDGPAVPMEMQR